LEEDCPISSVLKRNKVLAERTQLFSIQQGTKKEVSEEDVGPIEEIEGKQVEEEKDFNKENKTKNEMSNNGAMEAVNPKKHVTTALERNGEYDFDSILKPINRLHKRVHARSLARMILHYNRQDDGLKVS
jgi:hypothetical protein